MTTAAAGWASTVRATGADPAELDRETPDGITQGEEVAHELLALPVPPTALVCASDSLALGALQAVRARGVAVAVTGFDDTPVAQAIGLTSVSQPLAQAAASCVDLLASVLDGGGAPSDSGGGDPDDPGGGPAQVLLAPSLVIRQSG